MVLREVSEKSVAELLAKKDALAACDVAAFVYDRYDLYVLQLRFLVISAHNDFYRLMKLLVPYPLTTKVESVV